MSLRQPVFYSKTVCQNKMSGGWEKEDGEREIAGNYGKGWDPPEFSFTLLQ
jgi:hypothetical protein